MPGHGRKILFLADALGAGGAERQLALLLRYLPDNWTKHLIALEGGDFLSVIENYGVRTVLKKRKFRYDVSPFFTLWSQINSFKPDLVHSWGHLSTWMVFPFCKMLGIPLVDSTIRSGEIWKRHRYRTAISYSVADRVVANSLAGLNAYALKPPRGMVIHNGFDPERVPKPRSNGKTKHGKFSVVMAARMHEMKDFSTFIRAASHLSTGGSSGDWSFLAIGQGPRREEVVRLAEDLNVQSLCHFPEAGIDVMPYLRTADAGVLLTNLRVCKEGISNSIMEYMVSELPVLCYSGGGNDELVQDAVTGFFVPFESVDKLCDKLIWLKENPEEAHHMGMEGRRRILEDFSVARMVDGYTNLYAGLLNA